VRLGSYVHFGQEAAWLAAGAAHGPWVMHHPASGGVVLCYKGWRWPRLPAPALLCTSAVVLLWLCRQDCRVCCFSSVWCQGSSSLPCLLTSACFLSSSPSWGPHKKLQKDQYSHVGPPRRPLVCVCVRFVLFCAAWLSS